MVRLTLWDKSAVEFSTLHCKLDRRFKIVIITSIIPRLCRVMKIIEETTDHVAHTIPRLADSTVTDLDIIVKIVDHNPHALRRIDLDVYMVKLLENQREPIRIEHAGKCSICCEEFGTGGMINSLNCRHTYHHHCIVEWVKKRLTCPCCRENLA
ncbi:hypothetical protein Bca101_017921 [Brassica carinata]